MVLDAPAVVLGALCLFPLAMAAHGLFFALAPRERKFRPEPLTAQRGTFLVLVGIGLSMGVVADCPPFVVFVGVATLTMAVQHLAPKAWVGGRVAGVCFQPLAIDAIEREGARVVLVLERGYRLVVPDTGYNQKFLAELQEWDDER